MMLLGKEKTVLDQYGKVMRLFRKILSGFLLFVFIIVILMKKSKEKKDSSPFMVVTFFVRIVNWLP